MYHTIFLDIGGVLLTNGWDHTMREAAAKKFHLNLSEFNQRHALTFDTYEIGKITLDIYLDRAVFYTKRPFSKETFKEFMFSQSQPYPEMIQLLRQLKERYSLQVIAVSNEGRELMDYRIHQFQLKEWIDFFVCSGYVGLRKPDLDIYHMALNIACVNPEKVIYIDDRLLLTEVAAQLGMQTIQHQNFKQTETDIKNLLSKTT